MSESYNKTHKILAIVVTLEEHAEIKRKSHEEQTNISKYLKNILFEKKILSTNILSSENNGNIL